MIASLSVVGRSASPKKQGFRRLMRLMPIQIGARLGRFISSRFVELAIRSELRSLGWMMAAASIVAAMCACGAEERSETFEVPPDRFVPTRPALHMWFKDVRGGQIVGAWIDQGAH